MAGYRQFCNPDTEAWFTRTSTATRAVEREKRHVIFLLLLRAQTQQHRLATMEETNMTLLSTGSCGFCKPGLRHSVARYAAIHPAQ